MIISAITPALGCWAAAGSAPPPSPLASAPPVYVEAPPRPDTRELFGALRELGVDVWIADDMRLGVRMTDAGGFERGCELLARLGHELESIDLGFLPITDLSPLIRLRSTERLDLRGTRAALEPLRHLGRLRSLSLAQTDLDSLAPLSECAALEQLDLSDARVDLTAVGALPKLRSLDLRAARTAPAGFEVRDGEGLELAALRSTTTIEQLDLSGTKVRDWSSISGLWTLRTLDLSYTNFAEPWLLSRLDELETLGLRRTAVSDVTPLARLDALRVVDLRDCELLADADIDALAQARPKLTILR